MRGRQGGIIGEWIGTFPILYILCITVFIEMHPNTTFELKLTKVIIFSGVDRFRLTPSGKKNGNAMQSPARFFIQASGVAGIMFYNENTLDVNL